MRWDKGPETLGEENRSPAAAHERVDKLDLSFCLTAS
jgi:hypothetical protein